MIRSVGGECLSDKIIQFRIAKIKQVCSVEDLSIADIANKLDFYSSELLCKFFKYHTGMSITEYRNLHRTDRIKLTE